MPMFAACSVAICVTHTANRLHVEPVRGLIAEVMVVLLSGLPAINAVAVLCPEQTPRSDAVVDRIARSDAFGMRHKTETVLRIVS